MRLMEFVTGENVVKSCYVSRKVLNREALRDWARDNGFKSSLPGEEFHVTQLYSKEDFDWSSTTPDTNYLYIAPDDKREIHVFDGGATVLHFHNDQMSQRWQQFIDFGASTSYPDYKAHVTITYKGKPKKAIPYTGELVLGPEVWKEVNSNWAANVHERPL